MKIRLSNKALVIVDALVATGLYGQSRDECAERLLYERLWQVKDLPLLRETKIEFVPSANNVEELRRYLKEMKHEHRHFGLKMSEPLARLAPGTPARIEAAERRALEVPPPAMPRGFERAMKWEVAQRGWIWWYPASGQTSDAVPGLPDRNVRPGAMLLKPKHRGRKISRHRGRTALERGINVKPIHKMAKVKPGLYNYRGYSIQQRAGEWVVLAEDGESVCIVAPKLQSMRRKIDAAEREAATKAHGND